jgi:hypothetical protein
MTDNARVQDSMFIDMKYIVLYRKLGFMETDQDIFVSQYTDTSIRIEAEKQRFLFNGAWYPLLTYKDMVKLECIDRLLKKGYSSRSIGNSDGFDLILRDVLGKAFASFSVDEWGKRYEKSISEFKYDGVGTIVLYTSQLAGGLVDYKTRIFTQNGEYTGGLFEKTAMLYPQEYCKPEYGQACDNPDFIISGAEVVKYVGMAADIVVPEGIKRLGVGAFWNNTAIRSVKLPQGLECIAGDAFVYCDNLKSVTIPEAVESIGDNPFAGCPNLMLKNLSEAFVLEDGVLFDKDRKSLIHYTPSKTDDVYAIPDCVQWIGKHSFYKCENLKKVVINKNAFYMGNNAFSDCANISLENRSPHFKYIDGILYNGDITQVYHYSLGSGVVDVKLQEGVRTIGRNSFWNAKMIETIMIPKSVRQIGYNPFAYCLRASFIVYSDKYAIFNGALYTADFRELICCTARAIVNGTIALHECLESIGRNAFTGCESLECVRLPESIKAIARGAFSGCVRLREMELPKSVEFVGDWVFNNCSVLNKLKISKNIRLENNALKNCPAEVIIY